MKVVLVFDDRDYTYEVPFKKLEKALKVTEEQVIEAVREVLKTS